MTLTMSKRQKILLLVLVLLLYIFVLVNQVAIPVVPKINEAKLEIQNLEEQKRQMEQQAAVMEEKQRVLEEKQSADERMNFYLLENGDITDSLYFIEKLSALMGKQFSNITVKMPEEKTYNDIKYYAFETDFSVQMPIQKAIELAAFIEGSPLKTVVTSFSMVSAAPNGGEDIGPVDVTMSVKFFALNHDSIDQLYKFSVKKFMNYEQWSAPPLVMPVPATGSSDPAFDSPAASGVDDKDGSQTMTADIASTQKRMPDLTITENSFLAAGDNVRIYSEKDNTKAIAFATKKYLDLSLDVGASECYIQAAEKEGKVHSLIVPVASGGFTVAFNIDFPPIKENENLGMHVKVSNNSSENVYILLANGRQGISIRNSSGEQILVKDEKERIYIL